MFGVAAMREVGKDKPTGTLFSWRSNLIDLLQALTLSLVIRRVPWP